MILYIVRHGKSHANINKLVTGSIDDELCDEGIKKSKKLSSYLNKSGIYGDYYFTSQWKRAQQTAKYLWPDQMWEVDARLGETDAGLVTDWTLVDFLDEYPGFYDNPNTKYPTGESHNDLNERVLSWFEEIMEKISHGSKVVLVSHSGPISCILQHIEGVSMEKFPAYLTLNSSLSIVDIPQNNIKLAKVLNFSICPDEVIL